MTEICPICNNLIEDEALECPSCGFKMLGATHSFKPIGANEDVVLHIKDAKDEITLKVLHGQQDGAEFILEEGRHMIGRNPNSEIFLNDMTVSRQHAIIEREGDDCTIQDENSFNGVWINNKSVTKSHLKNGDVIQIGAFELLYQVK